MGKPSKLRQPQQTENRWLNPDGTRKLYDRDKCPDGLDQDIWDLALYFEQVAESNGKPVIGRPILYTELSHRLRTYGVEQVYVEWVDAVKNMIDMFFDDYSETSINNFCSKETFDYIASVVEDIHERELLLSTGTRVEQPEGRIIKDRRTEEQRAVVRVLTRHYSEDEITTKMKDWQSRNEPGQSDS